MRSERRFALIQFAHVIAYHEGDILAATEAAAYLKTVVRRTTSSARLASACQRLSEASHQQRLQRSSFEGNSSNGKEAHGLPQDNKTTLWQTGNVRITSRRLLTCEPTEKSTDTCTSSRWTSRRCPTRD